MIKIAICDDEKIYREQIKSLILKRVDATYFIIKQFGTGKDLIASKEKFDFIFLDIELQDSLGVEIAQEFRKYNKEVFIFFITSYTQYISEAFKSMPFQYLMKPIDELLFNNEMNRALMLFKAVNNTLEISWNNEKTTINIRDIIYIEHYSRKLMFNLKDGSVCCGSGKLVNLIEILAPYYFVRIHNSFLLNLKYLKNIKEYKAVLKNKKELPISKKYMKVVRKKFSEKISGVII